MAATILKAEQLEDAFNAFNKHSSDLEHCYRELQEKVETLTGQLREARSARLAELVRKERLSLRLSQLLETLPGAILVIDGDGIIRDTNSQAIEMLNRPLVGRSWASIVKREVRAGGSEDGNIELRDGRWLSLSRRQLADEPGEVILLADVTESRQMSALRQRQERLSCIGSMTAEFAHQVRTPLAAAVLYASQLESKDDRQQRVAEKIRQRLQDLGRMVEDMLGYARGARPSLDVTAVGALFDDVARTLEAQLNPETTLQISTCDASLQVAANKDALKGAITNLVINAEQAGAVNIALGAYRDDDALYITVADDGAGISAEILPRLFEPFFTTRPQGTGLGLAVVAAVAAAHGGDVTVQSTDNGTRFSIRLPGEPPQAEDRAHG